MTEISGEVHDGSRPRQQNDAQPAQWGSGNTPQAMTTHANNLIVMLALSGALNACVDSEPRRLDARDTSNTVTRAGSREVRFRISKQPGARDKGKVKLLVLVDGNTVLNLDAKYDDDLWHNEPAGWYWPTDFDRDGLVDVRLKRNSSSQHNEFWIRGTDGKAAVIQ